jgi:transposase InsO family protein
MAQHQYAEARQLIDTVLQVAQNPTSGQGLLLAPTLLREGMIALAQGRAQEAVDWGNRTLRDYQQRARKPTASADVGEAELWLARARRALNDDANSRDAAHQVAAALAASLGADNPLTREALALQ